MLCVLLLGDRGLVKRHLYLGADQLRIRLRRHNADHDRHEDRCEPHGDRKHEGQRGIQLKHRAENRE